MDMLFFFEIILFVTVLGVTIIKLELYYMDKHNFIVIKRYKIPYYKTNCLGKKMKEYIHNGGFIECLKVKKCSNCGKIRKEQYQDFDCNKANSYLEYIEK